MKWKPEARVIVSCASSSLLNVRPTHPNLGSSRNLPSSRNDSKERRSLRKKKKKR